MNLDIDQDKLHQPLSLRERIAIRILIILFYLVAPLKYQHQLDKFMEEFWK